MNLSNKKAVSVGPPEASGWNWAEKKGLWVWMIPSLERSLAFKKRGLKSEGRELVSTANPWFWGVM